MQSEFGLNKASTISWRVRLALVVLLALARGDYRGHQPFPDGPVYRNHPQPRRAAALTLYSGNLLISELTRRTAIVPQLLSARPRFDRRI